MRKYGTLFSRNKVFAFSGVYFDDMLEVLKPLLKAAKILGVQVIVTEFVVERESHSVATFFLKMRPDEIRRH